MIVRSDRVVTDYKAAICYGKNNQYPSHGFSTGISLTISIPHLEIASQIGTNCGSFTSFMRGKPWHIIRNILNGFS